MHAEPISDQELIITLVAVGAERGTTVADFDRSFEDLDLDSLARMHFAARVKDGSGVDVEESVTPEAPPNQIRRLVLDELSAHAGR